MKDQANGQSGTVDNAASGPATEQDLASMFESTLTGEQPKGQATPVQGENAQADSGENPEQVEEQPDGEQAPAKFVVPALEGDGTEELTAEELKAQRLMQADYTRKTQQVAEERKAIAAERAKVEAEISQRVTALDTQLQQTARVIQSFDQQVDWEALRQVNPGAYLEAREQQQARMQSFEQGRKQLEAVKNAQRQERIAASSQRLVEALPELLDPQSAKKFAERLVTDAQAHYGFTAQEIDAIDDHRFILALKDAAEYRAIKAKTDGVKQKLAAAPQLAKPGAPRQGNPQALDAYRTIQKARSSGSLVDMAAAFLKAGV